MVNDLKTCPQCAETVRFEAKVCKHCGHEFYPSTKPQDIAIEHKNNGGFLRKALGCVALLFIAFVILGIVAVNSTDETDKVSSNTTVDSAKTGSNADLSETAVDSAKTGSNAGLSETNFSRVKTGMTLDEVSEILGPGELSQEMDIGGTSSTIYQWGNPVFGGIIIVTFINGKVFTKASIR